MTSEELKKIAEKLNTLPPKEKLEMIRELNDILDVVDTIDPIPGAETLKTE